MNNKKNVFRENSSLRKFQRVIAQVLFYGSKNPGAQKILEEII